MHLFYNSSIAGYARNRREFVSSNGRLGIGSTYVQPGDKIAILPGANIPFVLREREAGGWRLIGEAYIDSIMHGEAVKSNLALQVIQIY
ncbi:hypothetical protein BGZ60DRAFT_368391 [Tricladium varicosporioides]|nr:hypothetical protein BGZ60DRAFT_368391 [Hymenoscyphus varicosporioides]